MLCTLTDAELLRYSRQVLLDGWDIDAQIRLKESRILIVGMGGLGTWLTPILVRAGVGEIHVVDFDKIDLSNLQRQMLYTDDDVGKSKAISAGHALSSHNPFVNIHTHHLRLDDDNLKIHIKDMDLVVDCSDNFEIRYALNRACVVQGVPLLSISALGRVGQMSLFEPNKTGCYACLFDHHHGTNATCATTGVLTSTVAVVGAMGADAALSFLGLGKNPLADTLVVWQGGGLSLQKIRFQKKADCEVCTNQQG